MCIRDRRTYHLELRRPRHRSRRRGRSASSTLVDRDRDRADQHLGSETNSSRRVLQRLLRWPSWRDGESLTCLPGMVPVRRWSDSAVLNPKVVTVTRPPTCLPGMIPVRPLSDFAARNPEVVAVVPHRFRLRLPRQREGAPPRTCGMPDWQPRVRQLIWRNRLGSLRTSCLLYTSPSPRDRTRSRMPSSA